tara:strand:- start:12536 stop:12955 length:420 start_codon:yes stop_codon:yes gene_type:complete
MEKGIASFLERMSSPSKKMSISELRDREETWRALWSWIPDDVKYYILRVGQIVRVIKRDYKGSIGELGSVKFKLDEMELAVYEKSYNQTDNLFYYERKVVKIPAGAIMMQEFVLDSELVSEEQPEVMGLEDEIPEDALT